MTNFTPPNCPKCDGPAIAPVRQGMSIPFKCTKCEHVFGMSLADTVLSNANNKIFVRAPQS